MSRVVRILLLGVLGALGFGAMAGPASAGIWTAIPSGTTDTISAIDYQSATRFWYVTSNGKAAFRNPDGTFGFGTGITPGVVFNDVAFQPGGLVGIAVGNTNNVWRTTNGGVSWTEVAGLVSPNNDDCFGDPDAGTTAFDNGYSVTFASATVVYITGNRSDILKSTNAGANFTAVNKKPNDDDGEACFVDARVITDASFISETRGLFVSQYFGETYETDNGLTGNTTKRDGTVNNFDAIPRIAWDPGNPLRAWGVDRCLDCFSSTSDGGSVFKRWGIGGPDILPEGAPRTEGLHDIGYAGGTVLSAGNAGQILSSNDGQNFFYQAADAPNTGRDWKAVDLADAANGAVGGAGGALVISAAANTVPDIAKPTGTIAGPATAVAGRPVAFTLNAADTGGSGINPASIAWTATGVGPATGNPATFTFPAADFVTVKVTFADNAGNVGEATKSVSISAATGGGSRSLPVSFTGPGNSLGAKIIGKRVRVRARGTITPPAGASIRTACSGKVKLTVKKKRKTLATRSAKLKLKGGRCRFGKTIFIKRSKVGKTTTRLRLKISFKGNSVLAAGQTTKTLVLKK